MSVVSKPAPALQCKRLTGALIAVSLCTLISACGNDDDAAHPSTLSSTHSPADHSNTPAVLPANPSLGAPAPAALTIRTPALPASGADATLSAAASTPLATPIIHTVE
ncbi:conserved exported hypothetical protein [Paraburkholderia ribeironis]|uniref:Lipoprotein n=1 Tax=Paraburkholderia ribeironis TaxID=1247936 RepID=A0A1N7RU63_9BURK|nr:hypothetical protein [Paraburkholderia ribeironis]SIT38665.1 conserved exported hypothetical protein [Paraburkholderia ribeironis]